MEATVINSVWLILSEQNKIRQQLSALLLSFSSEHGSQKAATSQILYSEVYGTGLGANLLTEGYAGICVKGSAEARHQKTVIMVIVVERGEDTMWTLGSGEARLDMGCRGYFRIGKRRQTWHEGDYYGVLKETLPWGLGLNYKGVEKLGQ